MKVPCKPARDETRYLRFTIFLHNFVTSKRGRFFLKTLWKQGHQIWKNWIKWLHCAGRSQSYLQCSNLINKKDRIVAGMDLNPNGGLVSEALRIGRHAWKNGLLLPLQTRTITRHVH